VTTGSRDSTDVTPWPLRQGLIVVVIVPTYVTPSQRERGTGIGCRVIVNSCCFTTNAVDWVVWHSNHHAIPSSATTSPDLPVRLAPSGTALRTVPRPKGPVYQLRGCWPFVDVMPQDVTVYRHAGRSSLTSWGTFRAAWTVPGWDVLVAAALAFLARESRELVRDVSHHG
jgi:hypothetical protein